MLLPPNRGHATGSFRAPSVRRRVLDSVAGPWTIVSDEEHLTDRPLVPEGSRFDERTLGCAARSATTCRPVPTYLLQSARSRVIAARLNIRPHRTLSYAILGKPFKGPPRCITHLTPPGVFMPPAKDCSDARPG